MKPFIPTSIVALGIWTACIHAATTINDTDKHAWGGNTGWSNWEANTSDGAVIGAYFCSGYIWDANTGWLNLGDGTPTNGIQYSNTDGADSGVNHDGVGNLSGLGWSANLGWVNFHTNGAPNVDLVTGNLGGAIWCPNTGWISLSNASAFVKTDLLDPGPDTDGDGIPDPWELDQAGDLGTLTNGGADSDADGIPDVEEYAADTSPTNSSDYLHITTFLPTNATGNTTLAWPTKPTRIYRVGQKETLNDVEAWSDSGLGDLFPGSGITTETLAIPTTITGRYYRVSVRPPLAP